MLAYVYLGLAVLLAAMGSSFLICRYDPFVGFFRLNGSFNMIVLGTCFLVMGLFVGRPYCRFLCPYGALLSLLSRYSRWRVTITPDRCIQCSLCRDACPFGAIQESTPEGAPVDRTTGKARLAGLLLLLPVLVLLGGWLTSRMSTTLSRDHATVRLAERIHLEATGAVSDTTDESDAFRRTGESLSHLYARAITVKDHFLTGSWILGGFVGLVVAGTLIGWALRRQRKDYEADRALCVACGRCFLSCPMEHERLKERDPSPR
jgi:ferredoxin